MKCFFVFLLMCLALKLSAQKLALLDTKLSKPILYTDSLTLDQISQGYFPMEATTFDTMYTNLKFIRKTLTDPIQRAKMSSYELKAGITKVKVSTVKHAYGDSYDIYLISKINEIASTFKLGKHEDLSKGNLKKIDKLMAYMKNASSLFKSGYVELQPTVYDVVIYQ